MQGEEEAEEAGEGTTLSVADSSLLGDIGRRTVSIVDLADIRH